jgi:hypothetical protein
MAAILYLSVDLVVRFTGYSAASWLEGLEPIAFLVMVIGAAVLALQARVEQAAHAAEDESDHFASPLQFHISDGGAGLPVKQKPQNRNAVAATPAPLFDGGSFPLQFWRRSSRR